MGLAYSFRGSIHYRHGGNIGSIQVVDMVLEKELRVLHDNMKAARRRLSSVGFQEETGILHWVELKPRRHQSPRSHLHTPSYKETPTPTRPHLLVVLFSVG